MGGLQIHDVYAGYSLDIMILQGVSLAAVEGEITAVLGANGVGKSTLLKTVSGFVRASRGRVVWRSHDLTELEPWDLSRLRIAFIPQGRSLFPYMTVDENIRLGCWSFRRDGRRVREAVNATYGRFPALGQHRKQVAGDLSGGQQRLLEMARALLGEPELLLVDEPTAGLAPAVTDEIYRIMRQLRDQEGRTIVLVDQNIRKAVEIADQVYVLELGRNKSSGPASEFLRLVEGTVEHWLL
jgi:ABC-type branched-subunit amino acid transport system ATPase component